MFNNTKFEIANLERIERQGWQCIAEFDEAIRDWEAGLKLAPKQKFGVWLRGLFKKGHTRTVPTLQHDVLSHLG